jgi:hypothetical protein
MSARIHDQGVGGAKMGIMTLEGTVEHGQIRLQGDIRLPEKAKVYVIIPGMYVERVAHIFTPHLANPEQAKDFHLEIVEEPSNADV